MMGETLAFPGFKLGTEAQKFSVLPTVTQVASGKVRNYS